MPALTTVNIHTKPPFYDLLPLSRNSPSTQTRTLMPKIMDDYYESKSPTVSYEIRFQPRREIPLPKWITDPPDDPETPESSNHQQETLLPATPSETSVATTNQSASSVSDNNSFKSGRKPLIILMAVFIILLIAAGILGYAYHYSKPKIDSSSRIGTVELYDPNGGFAGGVSSLYTLTKYDNNNFKIQIPDKQVTFRKTGNQLWLKQANLPDTRFYTGPFTVIYFNNDIILECWGNPNTNTSQTFHEGKVHPYHAHKQQH